MPVFLLPVLAFFRAVPAWAWKWLAVGLVLIVVFFYGYNKGKGVERARCEERARIAQEAANTQDSTADKEVRDQERMIVQSLTQQKKADDARISQLQEQLNKRLPAGKPDPCLYDKSTADPDDPPSRVRNK